MAFSGIDAPPEAHGRAQVLVQDYIVRRNLKEIGFNYDLEDLTDFEAKYLMTCQAYWSKLEKEQAQKNVKGRR